MIQLKTIVVEDEPKICKEIEWLVDTHPELDLLCSCTSVEESIQFINKLKPDLVLFDIQLGDGTSFDILNQLLEVDFHFLFITAFEQYSIKSIKYGAFDYLLKPINEEEFNESITRIRQAKPDLLKRRVSLSTEIIEQRDNFNEETICLASRDFIQLVRIKDIVYCESDGGYTSIYLNNGNQLTTSKTLKYYEDLLRSDWFIRCHQSYLVNKNFIDKFFKIGELSLKNGKTLPVSLRRKDFVMEQLRML